MKNLERLFGGKFSPEVSPYQDPLQFAYSQHLGVEDAVLTLLHNTYGHLEKANSAVRLLFIDFSSAFNTISPCKLARLLLNMDINPYYIMWLCSFLTERSQRVRFKDKLSDIIITNTGAPQGCVLSPLLFTLYTSRCRSDDHRCKIIKYADDTAIMGLVTKQADNSFFSDNIEAFVNWCSDYHLHLNVKKTKELIIDFGRKPTVFENIIMNNEPVERVAKYKYLGTIVDNKLNWHDNINAISAKCNKRLYFLRKLKEFKVDMTIMRMFYSSVIQSVLCFSAVCWYGGLNIGLRNVLMKTTKTANRIIGDGDLDNLTELYNLRVVRHFTRIMNNPSHPLRDCYVVMRSGVRLKAVSARTNRYKLSFVGVSTSLINDIEREKRQRLINMI
jgi:hypothetical protein